MIIEQRIKDFEAMEFGMFVHFGLYSIVGRGEWSLYSCELDPTEYSKLPERFNPDPDWAPKLVATAKAAGCKYITLTTRHHDGFSLYDASPISDYDAPHALAGRDLVREFVDACRAEGIVPFFYHTLLDWKVECYKTDFKKYLEYLRASVEILCTRYGKIGGLWFDGKWDKKDADWEEDALYALIRKHQPDAMIINNTGLHARGALGHIELDSVTFERGKPQPINMGDAPKYIASEMCQVFGDHWGYASLDYNFKSLADIIKDYCVCRHYGSNLLMNVGPMANGKLRTLDTAMLVTLGEWINTFSEACVGTLPTRIAVDGTEDDFVMKGKDAYYLFCHDLPMGGNRHVALTDDQREGYSVRVTLDERVKSIEWLEDGSGVEFEQNGADVKIWATPQPYGQSVVVRIAKIITE